MNKMTLEEILDYWLGWCADSEFPPELVAGMLALRFPDRQFSLTEEARLEFENPDEGGMNPYGFVVTGDFVDQKTGERASSLV